MPEQYGQIVGGFGDSPKKLSGGVTPLGQIGGNLDRAATGYEKDYEKLDNLPQINGETLIGDKDSFELHIVGCKTTAQWSELTSLVSKKGEIYIYSDATQDAQGNPVPMAKFGDGNAYVIDLPFASAIDMRISAEDIANWNNKVAVRIENDRLIFY